jgi:hypothetical protein
MIFRENGRMLGRLCLNRRADKGDFSDEEMTLLKALYVQFNVAARRVCRFERERKSNTIHAQNGHDEPATLLLDERCAPIVLIADREDTVATAPAFVAPPRIFFSGSNWVCSFPPTSPRIAGRLWRKNPTGEL